MYVKWPYFLHLDFRDLYGEDHWVATADSDSEKTFNRPTTLTAQCKGMRI